MIHAYLIMAHNNFNQLKMLIKALDDENNRIYVHIDSKSTQFNEESFIRECAIKKSKLMFIERKPLYWGTLSEVDCELRLMQEAVKEQFDYCHLLSGQDLPIKALEQINAFFEAHNGYNFIEFNNGWFDLSGKEEPMHSGSYKINYYHPFVQNKNYRKYSIIKYSDHFFAHIQKWLKMKRHKDWSIYAGSQFFSINYEFANYVVGIAENIRRDYKCTLAASEVFMQTTIMQSPFKDTVWSMETEKGNLRYIDWSRREGTGPRTFRLSDLDSILSLPDRYLFGRKFNESIDKEIISSVLINNDFQV